VVVAPGWKDTGDNRVSGEAGWIGIAAKDPHSCHLDAACGAIEGHQV